MSRTTFLRTDPGTMMVAFFVLMFAVACVPHAGGAPVGDMEVGLTAAELEGTKWVLSSYGPAAATKRALAKPQVTIAFHDLGVMHGMAGCNTYATKFKIEDHGLFLNAIEQTPFGCSDEQVWAQEKAFLAALATSESIELTVDRVLPADHVLTISYAGGQLRFNPEPPASPGSLENSRWQLISFGSWKSSQPAIPGAMITADFDGNRITGTAGCNSYDGAYETEGLSFTMWEIVMTAETCDGKEIMGQEARYVAALHSADAFTLDDNTLTISHDGGTLRFGRLHTVEDFDA